MTTNIMRGTVRWGVALAASAAIALGGAAFFAPQAHAATGTPISSVEDFKTVVNNNPSGSYYLTNDIDFAGSSYEVTTPFTGTLNGKGYTIKNYNMSNLVSKTTVLFSSANGATFKNIKLSGYKADINNRMKDSLTIASLIRRPTKCTFDNVTVTGSIAINSPNREASAYDYVGGIAAYAMNCTFKNCTNKVSITVSDSNSEGHAGGIAAAGDKNTFTKCTNAAAIKVTGVGDENAWVVCGISASGNDGNKFTTCSNKSAISYKVSAAPRWSLDGSLGAAGIANKADSLVSCSNSGAITVNSTALKGKKKVPQDFIGAAGVAMIAYGAKKCSNTGAVSYTGIGGDKNSQLTACVGGVIGHKGNYTAKPVALTESFNTGKVTVKLSEGTMRVGGVAGDLLMAASNCYNTGAVSLNKGECVGGVFGYLDNDGKKVSACYNTGKITGGGDSKAWAAAIAGKYDPSRNGSISSMYYTSSGKGIANVAGAKANAKKVSSISFGNCPGLSSKYWKSSKGKLILKWQ